MGWTTGEGRQRALFHRWEQLVKAVVLSLPHQRALFHRWQQLLFVVSSLCRQGAAIDGSNSLTTVF